MSTLTPDGLHLLGDGLHLRGRAVGVLDVAVRLYFVQSALSAVGSAVIQRGEDVVSGRMMPTLAPLPSIVPPVDADDDDAAAAAAGCRRAATGRGRLAARCRRSSCMRRARACSRRAPRSTQKSCAYAGQRLSGRRAGAQVRSSRGCECCAREHIRRWGRSRTKVTTSLPDHADRVNVSADSRR